MEFRNILLILVIIVLLYLIYKYLAKGSFKATGLSSGKEMLTISTDKLAPSVGGNSSNFAYSIWFYVDDWNYRYGETKILFARKSGNLGDSSMLPCPSVELGSIENNINVKLAVFGDSTNRNVKTHTCTVENVPIQRWVNLIVSVYGRSLDIYLDGKLVRTCVLPGVAKVDNNATVYITPLGGFAGWTSRFKYMPDAINTQDAWNIYQDGYGANVLGNTFGSYGVKVALMKENNEQSSFQF